MPDLVQTCQLKLGSGEGLVDIKLAKALRRLYEGPLYPRHLMRVELALRAFIVCNSLSVLPSSVLRLAMARRLKGRGLGFHIGPDPSLTEPPPTSITNPFGIDILDDQFSDPRLPLPHFDGLKKTNELDFVSRIKNKLMKHANKIISNNQLWSEARKARQLIGLWYGEDLMPIVSEDDDDDPPFFSRDLYIHWNLPVFVSMLVERDTRFLLDCYRNKYAIFSCGPVFDLCENEVFTNLPTLMLDDADQKYRELSRFIRQPGLAVDLPLLTTLVLSRASSRSEIPTAIVELRVQYQTSRQELWAQIEGIWEAETVHQQRRLYDQLIIASENLFEAAFPKRKKVMAAALQAALTPLVPSAGIGSVKEMMQQFESQLRVGALSFAKQLSDDLHRDLVNQAVVLRRHLLDAELVQFGLV